MNQKKTAPVKKAPAKAAAKAAPKKPAAKAPAKAPAKKAPQVKPVAMAVAKVTAPQVQEPPAAPIAPQVQEPQQEPQAPAAGAVLSESAALGLAALKTPEAASPEGGALEDQPTPEEQAEMQRQQEAALIGARAVAAVGVVAIEKGVQFVYPFVQLPAVQKGELQISLGDVIAKYASGGTLPPWFVQYVLPYIEELKLIGKLGAVGVTIYSQVKAEERRLAELAAQQQGQQGGQVDFSKQNAQAA